MATRIVVMGAHPGSVVAILDNSLPYPRDEHDPEFLKLSQQVHAVVTRNVMPEEPLTATPTGTLFQGQYDDMAGMARYLMALNLPFVIHHPPELREALLRLAEQMVQIATVQPPPRGDCQSSGRLFHE